MSGFRLVMSTLALGAAVPAFADPWVDLAGSCPGPVDLSISGLTPNGRFVILTGSTAGSQVIPSGSCAGVETDLANVVVRMIARADAQGTAVRSPDLPGGVCSHHLQILDMTTCTLSPRRTLSDTCDPASGPTTSCASIHQTCPGLGDGVYVVDADEGGPLAPFPAWCDMTTDGGGWTLVYRQQSDADRNSFISTGQVGTLPVRPTGSDAKIDDAAIRAITAWTDPAEIGYRWNIEGYPGYKYHPAACAFGNDREAHGTACADYTDVWTPGPASFSTAPHCDGFRYTSGGLKATAFDGWGGGDVAYSNWNQEGHGIQGDNACAPWSYTTSHVEIWAY